MDYDAIKPRRIRTIEMLTIDDVREIVIKDLDRYGVSPEDVMEILRKYVRPLEDKTDSIKRTYSPDYR